MARRIEEIIAKGWGNALISCQTLLTNSLRNIWRSGLISKTTPQAQKNSPTLHRGSELGASR